MTKIARFGSGSIGQRHGSADPDPDPYQNVMYPQHCYKLTKPIHALTFSEVATCITAYIILIVTSSYIENFVIEYIVRLTKIYIIE